MAIQHLSEETFVLDVVGALKPGAALDAACGAGTYAVHLAALGHQVIGVDSSPELLARARARLPEASFRLGSLTNLPTLAGQADLVVCVLTPASQPELGPVFGEFARVLRPGGNLVVTAAGDQHDCLGAANDAGFEVRRFEEPSLWHFELGDGAAGAA